MNRHIDHPPNIHVLISKLFEYEISYVISGSVAAQFYGVELNPGDLDITPATDLDNLEKIVLLLDEIEASPKSLGRWEVQPDGEKKWIEEHVTEDTLASWQPDPKDVSSLDHLFLTKYGNFDIVPELSGKYELLMEKGIKKYISGQTVWVAHIDELLAKLTIPRRQKDIPRVEQLRQIQRSQNI